MSQSRAGRKKLYDNEETRRKLEELIVEYRKKYSTGQVTFVKMADFSLKMHIQDSERFPVAFNRFVWAKQGRKLIESINTPIRTFSKLEFTNLEIPPIAKYVEEYASSNPKKLLSLLLPIEKLIFNLMESSESKAQQLEELKDNIDQQQATIAELKSLNEKLSQTILQIAVQSNVPRFRNYYSIPEILDFNDYSMCGLNDLKKLLYPNSNKKAIARMKNNVNFDTNELQSHWNKLKENRENKS